MDKPILSAERGAPDCQPSVCRQADLTLYRHTPFYSRRAAAWPKKISRNPRFRLRAAENVRVHEIFDLQKVRALSAAADDINCVIGGIIDANVPLLR